MESFFGGKRGASFVISKRYDTISASNLSKIKLRAIDPGSGNFIEPAIYKTDLNTHEGYIWGYEQTAEPAESMIEDFKKGAACSIGYGEYVVIDTITNLSRPSDIDNGKVYRRGFDTGDGMYGAQYIGQFTGPKGGLPNFVFTTFDVADSFKESVEVTYTPTEMTSGKLDDNIRVAYADVESNWETKNCYLGFKFPYPVFELESTSISAYDAPTVTESYESIDRKFYKKWELGIPKGIKGDAIDNLRIIEDSGSSSVIGIKNADGSNYISQSTNEKPLKKIIVYDIIDYTNSAEVTTTYYLGLYDKIDTINFAADGTVTVVYTASDTETYSNLIQWITNIDLSSDGEITVDYNNGATSYKSGKVVQWPVSATTADDGKLTFTCNNAATIEAGTIRWIKDVTIADNGVVTVEYNDGSTSYVFDHMKWLKDVSLADDGTLTFSWNNENDADTVLTTKVKWVDDINLQADGTLSFSWNTKAADKVLDTKLKWIDSTVVKYQASTSGTDVPTGDWSETIPELQPSEFLWTQVKYVYNDSTTSDPIYTVSLQGPVGPPGPTLAGSLIIGDGDTAKIYDGTVDVTLPLATAGSEGIVTKLWDNYLTAPSDDEKNGVAASPKMVKDAYNNLDTKINNIKYKFSEVGTELGTQVPVDITNILKNNSELSICFYDTENDVMYSQNLGFICSLIRKKLIEKINMVGSNNNQTFTFVTRDESDNEEILKLIVSINPPGESEAADAYKYTALIAVTNNGVEVDSTKCTANLFYK